MRDSASRLADVREFAHESGDREPDAEQLARFNRSRAEAGERVLSEMGVGTKLVAGGLIGGVLATILGRRPRPIRRSTCRPCRLPRRWSASR